MRILAAALLLALAWTAPAAAQQVVTSPGPEAVSVTVYRNGSAGSMDLSWLGGYALITETRTISLPAGESVIRFEGVAGNILPVSAIVRGLPREVTEKNHDARLLSAGALVDASLGRQVHIRRTDRATGKVTETEAIIRSGPDGIVLQTSAGFEALHCTGLPETLVYNQVPSDLSAKPTLAITTRADAPVTATVQLSYLASQFDWRANYLATVAPDGRTLDLFAWLTLANANDESFPDASTQVVAGRPNREEDEGDRGAAPVSPEISLHCWPAGTTSDVSNQVPPPPPPPITGISSAEIVVTGSRIPRGNLSSVTPVTVVTAQLEGLGDLKLYRIPVPVTVAANAQKQVALLHLERVRFRHLYAASVIADDEDDDEPIQASILLRSKNVSGMGLGRPLPSGSVAVFEPVEGRPMLVGEGPIDDTPVGQEVEVTVGESPDVSVAHDVLQGPKPGGKDQKGQPVRHRIMVSNAKPVAIDLELRLDLGNTYILAKPSRKLDRKNGAALWRAHVPANGTARLLYTIEERQAHDSDASDRSDRGS